MVSPARAPLCSRTVCRSARIWHGWNWSVSALITGTELAAAICSMLSWPNVRHTIAALCRHSTRAVSPIGSPRPIWLVCESITSGMPPSSPTPTENDTRVRVEDFVEDDRDRLGPGQRAEAMPIRLHLVGQVQHAAFCSAGLRSSSRRK